MTQPRPPAPAPDRQLLPGSVAAQDHGCICSVLANAAHRVRQREHAPLIDPSCPMHAMP